MKCPECGSQATVEQIGFDEGASENRKGFQISNPHFFPYYSKRRYYFLNYNAISWSYSVSLFLLFGFTLLLFKVNTFVGFIFVSSGLVLTYLGYSYYNESSNKIENLEKEYISSLLNNYYCNLDDIVFTEKKNIIDHKEDLYRISEALDEYDSEVGLRKLKYMSISGLVMIICFLTIPIFGLPEDNDNRRSEEANTNNKEEVSSYDMGEVSYPVSLKDVGINNREVKLKNLPNFLFPESKRIESLCDFDFRESDWRTGKLIDLVAKINIERYPNIESLDNTSGVLYEVTSEPINKVKGNKVKFSYVVRINPTVSELFVNARRKYGIKYAGLENENRDKRVGVLEFKGIKYRDVTLSPSDTIANSRIRGMIVNDSWECKLPEEEQSDFYIDRQALQP